jgi:hypothetical protein
VTWFRQTSALLGAAALIIAAGCAPVADREDRHQAGTLLRAFREHEVAYKDAIHLERQLGADPDSLSVQKIDVLRERFSDLHDRLAKVPVQGVLARKYLRPILVQLRQEEAALARLAGLIATGDVAGAQAELRTHDHAQNLLTPAVTRIRQSYGFAPQRSWRGRPLTA